MDREMTNGIDDLVDHMVNRFLRWRLPDDFNPDCGITFEPEYNKEWLEAQGMPPMRHEPVGTNLFDAQQAKAMVRYMLEGSDTIDRLKRERDEAIEACGNFWGVLDRAEKAEARAKKMEWALRDILSWFAAEKQEHPVWIIRGGAQGADDAIAFARQVLKEKSNERN